MSVPSSNSVRFVFQSVPQPDAKKHCSGRGPDSSNAPDAFPKSDFEQRLDEIQKLSEDIRRLSDADPLGHESEIRHKLLALNEAVSAIQNRSPED